MEIAMRGRGDYTVVDEVDAEWVAQRSWFGECNDGTGYVRCDRPCGKPGEYLHRLILLQLGDPPHPDMTVDHIDTDGFNNRRDNLRWAWPKEQTGNRGRGGTPRCR